ncbi:helix-turn-helix transcriptional regulator [Paenibacillus silvae]|uniref:helix-turn-helix transcriptional regulator n=1 Tax=Paenibacillus silvae TaxID=1325358 RepID=UPI0025A2A5F3|nr:helix-turn-helix transcriptional regulator [Paenibacillus silvae]MDM5278830.1 helix-turn-helix transcriptional regulator [Paenibacillus silvae]
METTNTQRVILKRYRKLKGTQRKVASDLKVTEAHWREIENSKSVPGTRLLFKICNYFGESVYVLFPDLNEASFYDPDSN